MKMQRITAALTAAAVAVVSSASAFPLPAFAENANKDIQYDAKFSSTVEINPDGYTDTPEAFEINVWSLSDEIKSVIGTNILDGSMRVTGASITYTVTADTDDFYVFVNGHGWNAAGEFIEHEDTAESTNWASFTEKTGTITTTSEEFKAGFPGIESLGYLCIGAGGKGEGSLTLEITDVKLNVSYTPEYSIPVTGTAKYTFDDKYLTDAIDGRGYVEVGNVEWEPFEETINVGDVVWDNPEGLKGITTVSDFVKKYNSVELKFNAADITGDAEVYAMIQAVDESVGGYQEICFPAQDVKEGQNVYTVDFGKEIKAAYDEFQAITVFIHAKEVGKTATMMLGTSDSTAISATGTDTFKSSFVPDGDYTVQLTTPEWWDTAWGEKHEDGFGVWYYGDEGSCAKDTVADLYKTYKGGEVSFNVKELNADVACRVTLQTRNGDNYGEDIVLADNFKVQKGENVIKFDLPTVLYKNPQIWGLYVNMYSDKDTDVVIAGTEIPYLTFADSYLSDEIDKNPVFNVGHEAFEEDFVLGEWAGDSDVLGDISTTDEFLSAYGGVELKFKAEDIVGDAEIYAMIQLGDETKDEWQGIYLPAQDIVAGQNVYSFNFGGYVEPQFDTFNSISVHFRSKEEGKTASFKLGLYDSTTVSATGDRTFSTTLASDEDGNPVNFNVDIETPEWWDNAWGELHQATPAFWWCGIGGEENTCLVDTVDELYKTYKGGELSFNVSGLTEDVTYQVVLMTRTGNNFGENIVLKDNLMLRNGNTTIQFDLPTIMYMNPEIWSLSLRLFADKDTSFVISAPRSSGGGGSGSSTSTPSTSEPATSDTKEEFKTEDKPLENIMEEVKPDTTASVEVAAKDTSIKADVFEAAKEKKVTLELKLENGVKWEIKAETIGDAAVDVNINVELNTSNVPAESVDAVASGKSSMQISLAHNGSFGFEANITIPVAPANNGKVANLFHFNNGALEFVASVTVSNGEATLPFSHASEYVIVFDEKSMGASDSSSDSASAPGTNGNPGTGAAGAGVAAVLAAASAAAVIICRKNKHN